MTKGKGGDMLKVNEKVAKLAEKTRPTSKEGRLLRKLLMSPDQSGDIAVHNAALRVRYVDDPAAHTLDLLSDSCVPKWCEDIESVVAEAERLLQERDYIFR